MAAAGIALLAFLGTFGRAFDPASNGNGGAGVVPTSPHSAAAEVGRPDPEAIPDADRRGERLHSLMESVRAVVGKLRRREGGRIEDVIPHLIELHALTLEPSERGRALEFLGAVAGAPDEDVDVRRMAILLLGGFPEPRSRQTLRDLTRDPKDEVAFWALLSLELAPIDMRPADYPLDEAVEYLKVGVDPHDLPGFNHRLTSLFWELALAEIAREGLDAGYELRLDERYFGPIVMGGRNPVVTFANSAFVWLDDLGDEELTQDAVWFFANEGRRTDLRLRGIEMVSNPGRNHPLVISTLANIAANPNEATKVRRSALIELGSDREFRSAWGIELAESVLASEFERERPRWKVLEAAFDLVEYVGREWLFAPGIKESWDRYWELLVATPGTGEIITNRMVVLAAYEDNFQAQEELLAHTRRDDHWEVQRRAIEALRAAPDHESTLRSRFAHLSDCARERPSRVAALAVRVLAHHARRLRDGERSRWAVDSLRAAADALDNRIGSFDSAEAPDSREAVAEAREVIRRVELGLPR